MKRLLYIIFSTLLFASQILAQGFEWELSPRLPFSIPKTYIGFVSCYTKNYLNGSLTLYENYFSCANFSSGAGNSSSFGIKAEHWLEPNLALNGSLFFSLSNGSFVADGDSFPVYIKNIPKMVKIENELSLNYRYLVFDLGAKYRIPSTHFFLGANLELGLKFSTRYDLFEQVKSPPEYHFNDNTQRRKIIDGKLSDLSLVFVNPKVTLGYDAKIFPWVYASPSISVALPIFNFSRDERLKILSIQVCLSLMRGI